MDCPLNDKITCPMQDVYGACFFCNKVNEDYAVSKIPILEADIVHFMEED